MQANSLWVRDSDNPADFGEHRIGFGRQILSERKHQILAGCDYTPYVVFTCGDSQLGQLKKHFDFFRHRAIDIRQLTFELFEVFNCAANSDSAIDIKPMPVNRDIILRYIRGEP